MAFGEKANWFKNKRATFDASTVVMTKLDLNQAGASDLISRIYKIQPQASKQEIIVPEADKRKNSQRCDFGLNFGIAVRVHIAKDAVI